MSPEDQQALDAIKEMFSANRPSRVGPDAGLYYVRRDPISGRTYIDRSLLTPLARQGYDIEAWAKKIEADLRARGKWPGG